MTELERLIAVRDYIGKVPGIEAGVTTYARVLKEIDDLRKSLGHDEMKDRAERAEAALSDMTQKRDQLDAENRQFKADLLDASVDNAALHISLSEAQDRAIRFEKMLKAEEARKAGEPVLDKEKVLRTAQKIACGEAGPHAAAIYFAAESYFLMNDIRGGLVEPYKLNLASKS